jgi:acyl-CoA dehydrogenase
MDFSLTQEQQIIIQTVRSFVERELYPHENLVERLDEVPQDLAEAIQSVAIASGLYAANMPEELGGGGLSGVDLTLVERELGRASYALQSIVARPSNILLACKGDQIEQYVLPSIRGERHDCLAMTEPGAGSDVQGMTTRAVRDGSDYLITGTKHFISHVDTADFIILFAVTGTQETVRGRRPLISSFLVDKDIPGLTVTRGSSAVSHRGYHQCELKFDDCRIPASALLGEEGNGLKIMGQWLGATRLAVAASCVGRAQRVLNATLDWAVTRQQFGQTIGRFQGVSFQLADSAVELEAANLLTLQAADKHDKGLMKDIDVAMAKLYATEALGRITDRAVQIFGGVGIVSEAPVERWWRDARVERIWDGTSEIQRHIISRALLRPLEN